MRKSPFLQHPSSAQLIPAMDYSHRITNTRQIETFIHCSIATANNQNVLIFKEITIADSTV